MTYLDRVLALATPTPTVPFPGDELQQLPPVPHETVAKEMFSAHRIDDMLRALAHCQERLDAIREAPPAQRPYHLMHINNHLSNCIKEAHALADALHRNYPEEWTELRALSKTIGLAKALNQDAKTATFSHLLQTVAYDLGHAKRHTLAMTGTDPSGKLWDFNYDHAAKHVKGALTHARKLAVHVRDNYPGEGAYLERLRTLSRVELTAETPEASTVPKPIGRPDGPGLWRHKHLQLPPYIQHVAHALMRHGHGESDAIHMAVGIVKHWAEGHDGHGHKTHPDVRAAAAANVAKWEEARAYAHAETAAKHAKGHRSKGDHELAASYTVISSCLIELTNATVSLAFPSQPGPPASSFLKHGTAPGARPITGRLFHVPSQTVAAGPPLPPGVTLPTPAELDAFAAELQSTLPEDDLIRGAVAHAHSAATKMRANQPVDALHMLKSCQTGIVSAHRAFNASQIPVANVFTASLDPAEQASAQASMYEGLDTRERYRKMTTQCAQFRDRIRRHYFHGMYNRMAEARF